jgi:hypothetical protein
MQVSPPPNIPAEVRTFSVPSDQLKLSGELFAACKNLPEPAKGKLSDTLKTMHGVDGFSQDTPLFSAKSVLDGFQFINDPDPQVFNGVSACLGVSTDQKPFLGDVKVIIVDGGHDSKVGPKEMIKALVAHSATVKHIIMQNNPELNDRNVMVVRTSMTQTVWSDIYTLVDRIKEARGGVAPDLVITFKVHDPNLYLKIQDGNVNLDSVGLRDVTLPLEFVKEDSAVLVETIMNQSRVSESDKEYIGSKLLYQKVLLDVLEKSSCRAGIIYAGLPNSGKYDLTSTPLGVEPNVILVGGTRPNDTNSPGEVHDISSEFGPLTERYGKATVLHVPKGFVPDQSDALGKTLNFSPNFYNIVQVRDGAKMWGRPSDEIALSKGAIEEIETCLEYIAATSDIGSKVVLYRRIVDKVSGRGVSIDLLERIVGRQMEAELLTGDFDGFPSERVLLHVDQMTLTRRTKASIRISAGFIPYVQVYDMGSGRKILLRPSSGHSWATPDAYRVSEACQNVTDDDHSWLLKFGVVSGVLGVGVIAYRKFSRNKEET